ncbi:MAG TPA: hypothetical protein VLV32_01695 [Burkholderiales bacterium]|nr:hypothetical protein [Burkholderiales bacterium]
MPFRLAGTRITRRLGRSVSASKVGVTETEQEMQLGGESLAEHDAETETRIKIRGERRQGAALPGMSEARKGKTIFLPAPIERMRLKADGLLAAPIRERARGGAV